MTQPTNPTGTPNGPWHPKTRPAEAALAAGPVLTADGTFTAPLTQCCGGMPGDVCDCASFAAALAVAFSRPIGWRAA